MRTRGGYQGSAPRTEVRVPRTPGVTGERAGWALTVHIFKGHGRQPWYVRLVSSNGQVLSVSEGYFSKFNAKRAARRMFPLLPAREV